MKIYIIIALLVSLAVAEDFSNPEYVNSLSDGDLVYALASGNVPDTSIISDEKLASSIESDLYGAVSQNLIAELNDYDLTRVLKQKLDLLDDSFASEDFEGRMQGDLTLINDPANFEIKNKWFNQYSIVAHKNARIMSFKDGVVSTGFRNQVRSVFNVNDFPGSQVDEVGNLVLAEGTKTQFASVVKSDGDIIITALSSTEVYGTHRDTSLNYLVDISDTNRDSPLVYRMQGVQVMHGDNFFVLPADGASFFITQKFLEIEGSGVQRWRTATRGDSILEYSVEGLVVYHQDGHKTFGDDTKFYDFERGLIHEVKKEVDYFETDSCDNLDNCISYLPSKAGGKMRVKVAENNNIKISVSTLSVEKGIKTIQVDKIKDGSTLVINDNAKSLLTFSRDPIRVAGQPPGFTIKEIEYAFGEEHIQKIEHGRIMQCSECREIGKVRTEDFDTSPDEVMQMSVMWAVRAAQDSRYIGEYGGRGEIIYTADNNDVIGRREPTRSYYKRMGRRGVVEAYDCIGFQGEAIYQATGRGYRWDLTAEGETLSQRMVNKLPGFQRTLLLVGNQRDVKSFLDTNRIWGEYEIQEGRRYSTEIAADVAKGDIKVLTFPTKKARGEYIAGNIPAGAPVSSFDKGGGMEVHTGIKGFGSDSIESHIGGRSINVEPEALEGTFAGEVYLITHPIENVPGIAQTEIPTYNGES
jgi:hypothetical protein